MNTLGFIIRAFFPLSTFVAFFMASSSLHAAVTGAFTVNTQSREEVRNFYNAIYPTSSGLSVGWTGSYLTGDEGAVSSSFQTAALRRINFLRALAGIPANVTFRSDWSAKAQKAALMMSLKGQLDHFPGDSPDSPAVTWPFWSEAGYEAAGSANLFLGTTNLDPISGAIDGYIADYGGGNERVGHRRWFLYPQSTTMGLGHVPGDDTILTPGETFTLQQANAVWVIDGDTFFKPRPAVRDGFIAWPPPGYTPYQLVYPRWSLSYPDADFASATVSMKRDSQTLNVTVEDKVTKSVGENTIVWRHPDMEDFKPAVKPSADVVYEVTVSNVKLKNNTTTNFTYSVTMFDPALQGSDTVLPTLTGTSSPAIGKSNLYSVNAPLAISGYEVRSFERASFNLIDGAESGLGNWEPTLPLGFTGINTAMRATGANAFWLGHLSTPSPRDALLALPKTLLVRANTTFSFRTRHGVSSDKQVARVQASRDGGTTWKDHWTDVGANPGEARFTTVTIDLSEYNGKEIQLRFAYTVDFGSFFPATVQQIGWFIDDVVIENVEELKNSVIATVAKADQIAFTPSSATPVSIQARGVLYSEFGLDWGPLLDVAPIEAAPLTPATINSIAATGANQVTIEFTGSSTPGATYSVQTSTTLDGAWGPQNGAVESLGNGRFRVQVDTAGSAKRFYRVQSL
jgi:hypothetical protein